MHGKSFERDSKCDANSDSLQSPRPRGPRQSLEEQVVYTCSMVPACVLAPRESTGGDNL